MLSRGVDPKLGLKSFQKKDLDFLTLLLHRAELGVGSEMCSGDTVDSSSLPENSSMRDKPDNGRRKQRSPLFDRLA